MTTSPTTRDLDGADRLLAAHAQHVDAIIAAAAQFLDASRPLCEQFVARRRRQLEDALHVLDEPSARGLGRFDLLRIGGFRPDENALSDMLAALRDPQRIHGLGAAPLRQMLLALARQRGSDPEWCERLGWLVTRAEEERPRISVIRELPVRDTIPDIAILAPSFTIFLENKVRGGKETNHWSGLAQTVRQWHALLRRADRLAFDPGRDVLGVLLTPEGYIAKCPSTVHLSTAELAAALRKAGAEAGAGASQAELATFLTYYEWL